MSGTVATVFILLHVLSPSDTANKRDSDDKPALWHSLANNIEMGVPMELGSQNHRREAYTYVSSPDRAALYRSRHSQDTDITVPANHRSNTDTSKLQSSVLSSSATTASTNSITVRKVDLKRKNNVQKIPERKLNSAHVHKMNIIRIMSKSKPQSNSKTNRASSWLQSLVSPRSNRNGTTNSTRSNSCCCFCANGD